MRSTFLLILGLGLSDFVTPATVCQAGWSAFKGKCYKHFSVAKSWEDAEATCLGYQGHLVSLHSTGENDFLFNSFGSTKFWIGGLKEGSRWTWSDGTYWNYQDWHSNQPSGDGRCSNILDDDPSQGTWNDLSCTGHRNPFVCQIDGQVSWNGNCVIDSSSPRLLPFLPGNDLRFPSLTPAKCIAACNDQNYNFAGVQFGHECWCGDEAPPEDKIVDMEECNQSCEGDSAQKCGATWRMNVYRIGTMEEGTEETGPISGQYCGRCPECCFCHDGNCKCCDE